MVMSISNLIENVNANYDKSNEEPIRYLKENLQPEDIMIYSDMGNGGVAATKVSENKQYFIYLTPENIGLTLKIQIYGKI